MKVLMRNGIHRSNGNTALVCRKTVWSVRTRDAAIYQFHPIRTLPDWKSRLCGLSQFI